MLVLSGFTLYTSLTGPSPEPGPGRCHRAVYMVTFCCAVPDHSWSPCRELGSESQSQQWNDRCNYPLSILLYIYPSIVCYSRHHATMLYRVSFFRIWSTYRLGWPRTHPWVGQSFLAERLGMTLTSRLRTPPRPRQALSSCPARCSVFFFSPWLSTSKFRLHIPDTVFSEWDGIP